MNINNPVEMAYSMNGLGAWTATEFTNFFDALFNGASKVVDSAKGNKNSTNDSNSSENDRQIIITQPAQDNTILYVAIAGILGLSLFMAFSNRKK